MSQKKRKYQDNYLDFGFTYLIEDDLQIPQCVVCMKTFSNSTMKPASLKQHLANAHPNMMSKNRSFFGSKLSKLSKLKRQKLDQTGMFWHTNKAAVHASYAIALHVAKTKMPHKIGETLLKPCILGSVKLVLGKKHLKQCNKYHCLMTQENPESMKCRIILRAKCCLRLTPLLFLLFS